MTAIGQSQLISGHILMAGHMMDMLFAAEQYDEQWAKSADISLVTDGWFTDVTYEGLGSQWPQITAGVGDQLGWPALKEQCIQTES